MPVYYYDATDSKAHADISTVHADADCHHLNDAERVYQITNPPEGTKCGTCCKTSTPSEE